MNQNRLGVEQNQNNYLSQSSFYPINVLQGG